MIVREIRAMTGIRGAAATFVMIYHFENDLQGRGGVPSLLDHGYLSVDLFFILSGFVLSHVYGPAMRQGTFSFGAFLWHRIARVYPLYLAATVAILAMEWLRARDAGVDAGTILSNMVMLQSLGNWPSIDPPAWSVSVELLAYLLFPLLAMLCLKGRAALASAAGMLSLAAILTLTLLASLHRIGAPVSRGPLDLFYSPYTILRCLAGFTIGQLIWRVHDNARLSRLTSRNAVQALVATLGLAMMSVQGSDFLVYLALIALMLCLSAEQGMLTRLFASRPVYFLGRLSFPIYLTHFKAIGLLLAINGRLLAMGMPRAIGAPVALLSSALIVICLSWMLHDWLERPCRRWLRRWQEVRQWRAGAAVSRPS
ncbi:acyltransferase family protein [Sphingobium bisphenolivorans]|uniref:acyltransferase family protein n=1 Tax=Sphingobium bisphenolivorans TaxID=1335760 RepID=UPI0003999DBC|nr:acyltransferase [Sphingobium bisphenolivorans]